MKNLRKFKGPIPGENYTSDTKNYAWHRPPDHTNLDDAIDEIATKLMSEQASAGLMTMMENGIDIVTLTTTFLMSGVGTGKWTLDMALLLAGPTSHIMKLMADGYGIDADMGIDDKIKGPSKAYFDGLKKAKEARLPKAAENVETNIEEVKTKARGLMDIKPEAGIEQKKMLGQMEGGY